MMAHVLVMIALLVSVAGCSSASGQPNGEGEPGGAAAKGARAGTAKTPASAKGVAEPGRATRVEVARIAPSTAALQIRLPGEVEGSREALLASSQGGFIERVSVHEGDEVKKGQVLVRVDAAIHGARTSQARIEVDEASRELARAERLGDAIPTAQLESARTREAAAKAALRLAQLQVARAVVRAPFDGVVADVPVEQGEVAGPGAPLVRLVRLDPVHVTLSVPDRDVVQLRPGMAVTVSTDARTGNRSGVIRHVNPAADEKTRAFKVKVEVSNEDHALLPGMIASVRLDNPVEEKGLVIPQDVLVTRRDANGVFVVKDDVARWRPLELGSVVRNQVLVTSGLEEGETVVVTGHRDLADGDRLIISRQGVCCEQGRVRF